MRVAADSALRRTSPRPLAGTGRRDLTIPVEAVEKVLTVLVAVLLGTQATQLLLGADPTASDQGANPIQVQVVFALTYALAGFGLMLRPGIALGALRVAPLLLAVIAFPLASVLWSVQPAETARRTVALLGTSMFGLYLGGRYSLPQLVRLLGTAYTIAGVGSLVVALAVPKIGLMQTETWVGTWRGFYLHKNALGAAAALGAVVTLYAALGARGLARVFYLGGLGTLVVLLVGSRSTSALGTFLLITVLMVWARALQRAPGGAVALAGALLLLGGAAALILLRQQSVGELLALVGKNAEMSGRFPLWEQVWGAVARRAVLGYGYEAFWSPDAAEVKHIALLMRYVPHYSHNGVLETLLNGGLVLLGLVAALFAATVVRAFAFVRGRPAMLAASFPLAFCAYDVFANFAESKLLARNDLIWAVFVALAFHLAREVRLITFPGGPPRPEPRPPPETYNAP